MQTASLLLFPRQITIVENPDLDVDAALQLCYEERERDPTGRQLSNWGGWQSRSIEGGDDLSEKLSAILLPMITAGLRPGVDVSRSWCVRLSNAWINISPPGSRNDVHIHPMSVFSGVLYLATPRGCGNIVFIEDQHRDPEIGLRTDANRDGTLQHSTYWIEPMAGRMLLFPAVMPHRVEPNLSDDDRVSIAFNIPL